MNLRSKLSLLILLLCSTYSYAQNSTDSLKIRAVENHLLNLQFDSASVLLKTTTFEKNDYYYTLNRIVFSNNPSYKDYLDFLESIKRRQSVDYQSIENFLSNQITEPENRNKIDIDYVWLKWTQKENVTNELLDVEKGSVINNKLEQYVNQFRTKNKDVQRAELLVSTHQMLMYNIARNVDSGKPMTIEGEQIAREMQDTTLLVLMLYHKSNFLYWEGDLAGYIKAAEEAYYIDRVQKKRSPYFSTTIRNLCSAYLEIEGNEALVFELINEIHRDPYVGPNNYYLYFQLLHHLSATSPIRAAIYKMFRASSTLELITKMNSQLEGKLNDNNAFVLAEQMAFSLIMEGEKEEAIQYVMKAISHTRSAYSDDLAKALANQGIKEVTNQKAKEIAIEKEKSKLYVVSIVGIGLLLLITFVGYNRKVKLNEKLEERNNEIINQRDAIKKRDAEKKLLLKEVHHRVKNNLQVISSLLDLQSRDINNDQTSAAFTEGQNRVKAMALIHQKLYQDEEFGSIDFAEYSRQLIAELSLVYPKAKDITFSVQANDKLRFDIDTAIPLGLILNELISNTYKYAFESNEKGDINIEFEILEDQSYQMIVKDNGIGLPQDFDFIKAKSLGLRLVRRLAKQLYGKVLYEYKDGAIFIISFKDTVQRKAS